MHCGDGPVGTAEGIPLASGFLAFVCTDMAFAAILCFGKEGISWHEKCLDFFL
jgi:hypothetical protein